MIEFDQLTYVYRDVRASASIRTMPTEQGIRRLRPPSTSLAAGTCFGMCDLRSLIIADHAAKQELELGLASV